MRKFLAILLAVLMVVPAFAFTASAEEATSAQKLNIIPIITEWDMPDEDKDPEALEAWRGYNNGQWITDLWVPSDAVDANGNPVTGGQVVHYSVADKAVVRDWTGAGVKVAGWVKLGYQYFKPVDLSGIWDTGAVTFDLYLSDPAALGADTVKYDFELHSAGGSDDNEFNADKGVGYKTLSALYGGDLQQGWNHFEIPLSFFGLNDKADDGITPDKTQINYFRILNADNNSIGTDGENHKIMMKNLCFVDQCTYKTPEAQIVDIWDGNATQTTEGYGVTVAAATKYSNGQIDIDGDGNKEFVVINANAERDKSTLTNYGLVGIGGGWQNDNYGIKNWFNLSAGQFDASENAAGIRFEIYVSDTMIDPDGTLETLGSADAYDTRLLDSNEQWTFEITSARTSDFQEISWTGALTEIFGHQLVPNTWVPVVLMFDKATHATPGDASEYPTLVGDFVNNGANFIRLYNGDSEHFTFTGDLTIAMRNFQSIREVEEETTERRTNVYGIEDDNGNCKNRQYFTPVAYADSMPWYANAGAAINQAVISEHFLAGVQDQSENGPWGTRTGELRGFTPINATGMDTLCFDLYVQYYGDASLETMLDNTWDGVKMDEATDASANPFHMEISSAGKEDHNEYAANTSLAKLTGIAKDSITSLDDVNGWHHIEIPLSQFKQSTTDKMDWTAINYFCLWLNGPYTAAEGVNLMLAIDNLYFKDSAEIKLSGTPLLTNSFNLSCAVTTSDLVVSNPLVDVAFDGKATSESSTFAFNGILAHRLSDKITVTVMAMDADHKLIRQTFNYSIKQYAENMLAKPQTSDALQRLLSDMLYYGGAAQSLIDYNAENLASDVKNILAKTEVTADTLNASKIENVLVGKASENGPVFKSATLVLDSELAIRFAFTGETDSLTIGGETFGSLDFKEGDGYYYVDFPVSANHFDVVYTAYFGSNSGYCVNYSVNHYLATKYRADGKLADLLAAIYNYGVSADAYATATNQNN